MNLQFFKYQGTGNDFILIDNRQQIFSKNNTSFIKNLCDRKFGIGADGLILLEEDDSCCDFKMIYYNSDGNEGSMCGNGGRCIVSFAKFLGLVDTKTTFSAIDGLHEATINEDEVSLKMKNVQELEIMGDIVVLDTGSPHYVQFFSNIEKIKVKEEGAHIRYSEKYKKEGINVNFLAQMAPDIFQIKTYERGVEDETLSCGTGVTAAALAAYASGKSTSNNIKLKTEGGDLKVSFSKTKNGFENIWLSGPGIQVFEGKIKSW